MDFKSLRSDKLKLTQEEFANLYGISIQEVQELDKTGKPDMDLIVKIATKSGLDFNTILSYEKPRVKPINAKDTWEKTNFTKKSLSGYLNSALEQMDIPDDMRKNYIDDLEIGIMSKFVKPTVAIVGRSDTGKSTLINSLIGAEKMPAKWTPTTSTAVYVKHIKDRPAFIHDEAWIFKRECGNEKFWNSKRLYDEKYCEKWKVAGGDLSLLETYSTRQGGGLKTEAGSAVVFVDAPILLNCDIIDLPGYGTETASDDVITAKTAAHADVLIYLSLASGFLRIEDAGKIQEALLIGRNMVNKAPGDSECVNAYLDFLLMLAEKLPRTDERKSFADQANLVLSFYEENADLTDDIINDIHVYHNRLGAVVTDIAQLEQEEYEKQKRAIEATNTTQIKKLYTIKQKLENAKTHAEFDKLLQEISAVDAEIDHDNLTSEQKTHYDQLNKSCTDTISAKMRQLEYKDNIDYNKKAVNAYNSAFTSFKNNESRYKDKNQLFGLVSTTLFAYDAGRLFNETLIFYNHVYSYIFNKLDDNGKLELTKYSIECERKQG